MQDCCMATQIVHSNDPCACVSCRRHDTKSSKICQTNSYTQHKATVKYLHNLCITLIDIPYNDYSKWFFFNKKIEKKIIVFQFYTCERRYD